MVNGETGASMKDITFAAGTEWTIDLRGLSVYTAFLTLYSGETSHLWLILQVHVLFATESAGSKNNVVAVKKKWPRKPSTPSASIGHSD